MSQTTTRPRKRQNGKADARSKHTLLLDGDISRKLSVAASLRDMDRSDLVNEVLADALRYIVISVRGQGQSIASASAADGVKPEGAEAA